jgi:diphosphomevalonate decarboxylase
MQWVAEAPANIALIKYMGKIDTAFNSPANPSLSYTLGALTTTVTLTQIAGDTDLFDGADFLSTAAQQRFLMHLARVKEALHYVGAFCVQSHNNFPHSTGLASSASSFAALTLAAVKAISELQKCALPTLLEQARLSKRGSGSSCRSFFSPWALWDGDEVHAVELPRLCHQVILVSDIPKSVSSSEAHRRVVTSPYYEGRNARARERLAMLLPALQQQHWRKAYDICWAEFQDMHQLFSTCAIPFQYITPKTESILKKLQAIWDNACEGPLVTMDAGPNIHLLYPECDAEKMIGKLKEHGIL